MIKASKVGSLKLGMVAAAWLAAVPAWAQGDPNQPTQPGQGSPTGPAAQPQQPGVVVSSDGTVTAPTASAEPEKDTPQTLKLPPKKAPEAAHKPLPWAGSVFFFDQSVNSETVGVGKDYQSTNPSYQLWMSLRPRVLVHRGEKTSININARLDATKELTNADDTTEYRQTMLGDLWANAVFTYTPYRRNGWATTLLGGPRALFPTSLASQANGLIVNLGGGGGVMQTIPLNRGSEWFASGRLVTTAYYTHPFTRANVAESDELNRPRTKAATPNIGSAGSDTLSGGFLVKHQVLGVFDSGVQITPKLGFTFDMIFIQQWRHGFNNDFEMDLQTGRARPSGVADPQTYRLSTWVLAAVDYQLTDELNLSVGYYNFANTIGANGKRQNVFYAPEGTRFFLTATIGLDALYERFRGTDSGGGSGAQGSRVAKGGGMPLGTF